MKLKANSTEQKLRGAYYTPRTLADAMVRLADTRNCDSILEPSCGDGVFIEALAQSGVLDRNAQIDAVDVDEEALSKVANLDHRNSRIQLIHRDFFEFYEEKSPECYDLVLGNPPYIRYQYLSSEQRTLLSDILTRQGMKPNRLINAWVGFTVACTDLLKDGGTLAFVLPAELLQVAYAKDLRAFLASHYSRITILTFTNLVFEDVEQEIVVFIGKKGEGSATIRLIESSGLADLDNLRLDSVRYQPVVPHEEKWTRYFIAPDDASVLDKLNHDSRLMPFSKLALINVGVTTGNNSFFSITDATSHEYDLDSLTIPLIGRSSHAAGVFFTEDDWTANRDAGKRARLLTLSDNQYGSLNPSQKAYIDLGERQGVNKGYKCSIRNSWYSVPSTWIPDAFFLRRNNLYPKFVINECNAISTDTMHRLKFSWRGDPELMLISYYNSIAFAYTELCGRSYGGGVLEILPNEVGDVLVLNPELLVMPDDTKRDIVSFIDRSVRSGADIETVLDYVDQKVLVELIGFKPATCTTCRAIWKTLQKRRLRRGKPSDIPSFPNAPR